MSTDGRVTRRSLKSGSLNATRPVHKGGKSKGFTTRNLAALDFLRTIHMAKEPEIVENGMILDFTVLRTLGNRIC